MVMTNYQTIRELYCSAQFTGESGRGTWRANFSLRQKKKQLNVMVNDGASSMLIFWVHYTQSK